MGIAFAVMFAQNSGYQAKREWGYNQRETLFVNLPDATGFETMKAELEKKPECLIDFRIKASSRQNKCNNNC